MVLPRGAQCVYRARNAQRFQLQEVPILTVTAGDSTKISLVDLFGLGEFARPQTNLAARSAVQLGEVEVAIGAVWNHRLTGLETEMDAIEMHGDDIWFERH